MYTKDQLKHMQLEQISKLLLQQGWAEHHEVDLNGNYIDGKDEETGTVVVLEKQWEINLNDPESWNKQLQRYLDDNDVVATAWQLQMSGPILLTYILDIKNKSGSYMVEVFSTFRSNLVDPFVPVYLDFEVGTTPNAEQYFWKFLEEAVNDTLFTEKAVFQREEGR